MDCRVSRIFELLQDNRSGSGSPQFLGLGDGSFHSVRSRSKHKLRSQCFQQIPAFHAHRIGHGQYQFVTFGSCHKCQADTCISTGRLNNSSAGLQRPFGFGIFNHSQRDTVFHAPSRVEIFQFCHYTSLQPITCIVITQFQ